MKRHIKRLPNDLQAISTAFAWRETPDGNSYWRIIDAEWRKICNKQIDMVDEKYAKEHYSEFDNPYLEVL